MFYTETIKEKCQDTRKSGRKKFLVACLAGFIFGIFSGTSISLSRQGGPGNIVYSTDYVVAIRTSAEKTYDLFFKTTLDAYGSGIIFHQSGDKIFIVTNYHVIESAEQIEVSLSGTPAVSAVLMGYDKTMDLAVLFIRKDELTAGFENIFIPRFADSDLLRTGDTVLAVGNVNGQGTVMTRGIISATEREIFSGEHTSVFLQTDTSVNEGSSGGALLNSRGEIVGITTAKMRYRQGGGRLEGIGLCIPSNAAKASIESIMNQEKIPFLGIAGLTGASTGGILVEAVVPGSSAANGGLRRGDLITAFNGAALQTMASLEEKMSACKVGDQIELEILRDEQKLELRIRLE